MVNISGRCRHFVRDVDTVHISCIPHAAFRMYMFRCFVQLDVELVHSDVKNTEGPSNPGDSTVARRLPQLVNMKFRIVDIGGERLRSIGASRLTNFGACGCGKTNSHRHVVWTFAQEARRCLRAVSCQIIR